MKGRSVKTSFAAGLLLAATPLWAASAEAADLHVETPSLFFSLFRLVGALAVVFALFLGGVWLFRNWQRLAVQHGRAPKLNVLEFKSLGARHAIYVIGYERQRFLLSSAPTGISLLATLPPAEAEEPEVPAPSHPSFTETLAKALAPKTGNGGGLR